MSQTTIKSLIADRFTELSYNDLNAIVGMLGALKLMDCQGAESNREISSRIVERIWTDKDEHEVIWHFTQEIEDRDARLWKLRERVKVLEGAARESLIYVRQLPKSYEARQVEFILTDALSPASEQQSSSYPQTMTDERWEAMKLSNDLQACRERMADTPAPPTPKVRRFKNVYGELYECVDQQVFYFGNMSPLLFSDVIGLVKSGHWHELDASGNRIETEEVQPDANKIDSKAMDAV